MKTIEIKKSKAMSIRSLIVMCLFAGQAAVLGVTIGLLKNEEIRVRRDIDNLAKQCALVEQHTEVFQSQVAIATNRWSVKSRLAEMKSDLVDIIPAMQEVIIKKSVEPTVAQNHLPPNTPR